MLFYCEKQTLAKALNVVRKAVSDRSTYDIMKGVMIEARENDGKIILTGTNTETSIIKEIEADVLEDGKLVVMAKLFGEIVRSLPNGEIRIEDNNGKVIIGYGNSAFNVVEFPSDEFPEVELKEAVISEITIEKEQFGRMVDRTVFAASQEPAKGVLQGLYTDIKDGVMRMVAIDGFRLAMATENIEDHDFSGSFIIDAKAMSEINKIFQDDTAEDSVHISFTEKNAVFRGKNTRITVRLMEGKYIDYERLLTIGEYFTVGVEKKYLSDSVERASIFSTDGRNNLIRVTLGGDKLTIQARSEAGNVREEIPVRTDHTSDFEIGFNARYMQDMLKVIDDEDIYMLFVTPTTSSMIVPLEGDEYKYLLLPVRLPKY